ncbi:MAG TPA: MCE family protein [Bacteroidales bacterium]|nr:MAG: hypothetical protein A2X11_16190 [Bacteroidetes bacterium GWE2_42_24]OFY29189.1 MAG: hypothetical protein A2X09_05645 [Bacteroidetes bacterium GWF2_43_11]HAQ65527.1 MCE family protein [Bacteroidales bacterium]
MKISKEIRIGISFAAAVILFIWGFNFLKGSDLFTTKREFVAIYPQVGGLVSSSPVSINGVKVGMVNEISFVPDNSGLVMVRITVSSDLIIPANSIAHLYSADLMGTRAIEIRLGNSSVGAVSGDTLSSNLEGSLKDEVNAQVMPLKRKAEEMMAQVDSVLTALQAVFNKNTRNNLEYSFLSIKNTLQNLENTTSNIDTLVSTQRTRLASILGNIESITANLKTNNNNITNAIGNVSAMTDTLAALRLGSVFSRLNSSLNSVDQMLTNINKGQGTIGQLLGNDSLYHSLNRATLDLDALLRDLKQNPGRYVKFSVF